LLYGVGTLAHGFAPVAIAHAAAVGIWTLGEIIEAPTRSVVVAAMAPTAARGRYQGLLVMSFGAGQLIGPKLGAEVWEHVGHRALWGGCFGLGVIAAIALWLTAASRRARMEKKPSS